MTTFATSASTCSRRSRESHPNSLHAPQEVAVLDGKNMRDIDAIINALALAHCGLVIEQLQVLHRGSDDDGVWFFRHPASACEVQLESTTGACPFLFETDAHDAPAVAHTVAEAVSLVTRGLSLDTPQLEACQRQPVRPLRRKAPRGNT